MPTSPDQHHPQRHRPLRVILTNAAVLLVGLLAVNFVFSVIIDAVHLYKRVFPFISQPLYVESLPDQEHAHLVFRELRLLTKRYTPYMGWSRFPFRGEATHVNDPHGERVTPQGAASPARHIHFFGGSTMWGTGVDDHHTIPAQFHQLAQDSRVYNHAQSGFVSRQELARLINLVNQHEPMDAVIFYDGCNDPLTLCRGDVSINGHREEAKLRQKTSHRWAVLGNLFGSTQTAIRTVFKTGSRPPSRCDDQPDYQVTVARTIVSNWKLAKTIANAGGAAFYAILQPVARIGRPNVGYLDEPYNGADWQAIYPLIRQIAQDERLDWIHDFSDAFDGSRALYIDLCHVNRHGNAIIAEKLRDLVAAHQTQPR